MLLIYWALELKDLRRLGTDDESIIIIVYIVVGEIRIANNLYKKICRNKIRVVSTARLSRSLSIRKTVVD